METNGRAGESILSLSIIILNIIIRHHQRHQHHSHDHDHSGLSECIQSWQGGLEGSGPCVLQTNDSPHHDHDDNYGENGDEIFNQNLCLESKI